MESLWKIEWDKLDNFQQELNKLKEDTTSSKAAKKQEVKKRKEEFEKEIFSKYPKLNVIKDQLYFDRYSEMENIEPFLKDLDSLPDETLQKIKRYNNRICISDLPVTTRSTNKDLQWTARWRPEWTSRDNVWAVYRREQKTLYVWRAKINWHYIFQKENMLHEMWHMFDFESQSWFNIPSQTKKFRDFHKTFYNRLNPYFKQGWPWWDTGCSEFFAQACYQFFQWWEQKFIQYYNEELYNYMKNILIWEPKKKKHHNK